MGATTVATLVAMPSTIRRRLDADQPTLSLEFYPPKTAAGQRSLWDTVCDLEDLAPDFVSITYGAAGSTRDRTLDLVRRIRSETSLRPVMHLTCVGSTREELAATAAELLDAGITDVLALRGDPPGGPGAEWEATVGGFRYAAELVELLAGLGPFAVGVAAFPEGHPESPSLSDDVRHLAAKCAAGAEYAITQFFFDAKQYTAFVEELRAVGCDTPVVPGLLPVTNPAQTRRFAAKAGASFPPDLDTAFREVEDDPAAVYELGVDRAVRLARDLLAAGAPGLHFYTLNRVAATREVCARLRRAGVWRTPLPDPSA